MSGRVVVATAHSRDVGVARDHGHVVAVFITAIWGPDARFSSNDGNSSTIPTAVFVTVFAFLGTWIVAKYGFRQERKE